MCVLNEKTCPKLSRGFIKNLLTGHLKIQTGKEGNSICSITVTKMKRKYEKRA